MACFFPDRSRCVFYHIFKNERQQLRPYTISTRTLSTAAWIATPQARPAGQSPAPKHQHASTATTIANTPSVSPPSLPPPLTTANPSPMPSLRPPHAATERTFPTQHRQRWNLVCLTECIHWQLCLWTQKPCGQTDIKGICQAVCNSEYQLGEVCSIMESGRWYILQEHASFVPGPCPLMQQMYNVGWTPVTHLRAIQPCTTTCSSW